jgi:hypothetical protein
LAVTSLAAVFFVYRSLAGRIDASGIFIAIGGYKDKNTSARHSDDQITPLSTVAAKVSVFDTFGILPGTLCKN